MLPDSGLPVPSQLWLVETGFMHVRPLDDGGSIGGNFLFGSASDRPYAAGCESRPTDDWTFTANYFPLVNFNATARRWLADGLSLIAFYRSDTEIYFLADRL